MSDKFKIVISLFLLTGCSLGPDYQQPKIFDLGQLSENTGLKSYGKAEAPKDWYKLLKDENLNELITTALQESPDIASAYEKLRQARINLGLARAEWGPEISATGSYNQSNAFETAEYKSKSSYYQNGFDASWEIDIWGGIRRLNESQKALMKAAEANLDNVKVVLIAEVVANYINYRKNEKLLQITEQNLRLQKDIYNIIKQKHSSGVADDLSLQQAYSAVLNTKTQIPPLRASINLYKNNLAVLCGRLPNQINFTKNNLLAEKIPIDLNYLYNLPADIIKNRPDVIAAEQNLIAQNALIGNRIAALFPSISLSGFLGWQNTTLSPMISSDYQIYNWTGAVGLPLIDWKKRINRISLQKSVTKQALSAYRKSILTAVSDINNAMKNLTESSNNLENNDKNQEAQTKILELSWKKYKNGLINFSEILTAEQNKLNAEQQYIISVGEWYLNFISFNKSVGGGFAAIQHLPLHDDRTDAVNECDERDKH